MEYSTVIGGQSKPAQLICQLDDANADSKNTDNSGCYFDPLSEDPLSI